MENKEKEINRNYSTNPNSKQTFKNETTKRHYDNLQKNLLVELFKKLIKNSIPIEYKVFSNKYLKIRKIESNDTLEKIIQKIDENVQM